MLKNFSRTRIVFIAVALNILLQRGFAQAPVTPAAEISPNGKSFHNYLPEGVKKITDEVSYTSYAVYADDKSIYVKLFITDSLQKRKVIQNGIELWIDVKGKKNKITGILFPLSIGNMYPGGGNRIAAGGPPPFSQNTIDKNNDTDLAVLITKRQEMELRGFLGDINGRQNIKNAPPGISTALNLAADTLIYEASVAFNVLTGNLNTDKPVSIGIIEKGAELPGFGDMGGGPGDLGGGPPGGGDGGPPPGPPPGDMQDGGVDIRRLFDTDAIWYKLKLRN